MSWSHITRRVVYSVSLVLIAGLAFWTANQTLLANNHIDLNQVSPNAVTATANQPVRNWNHVFGSSSMTDCATARYSSSNDQTSAALTRTITWNTGSRRDGNYLCARTLVDTAERKYAYSSPLRIDLAGPTIRFESGRSAADSIQATVNDYNNLHNQASASTEIDAADVISGVSFRYAILRGSSDCSVRNLNLRTVDTDLVRTSTTADNSKELKVNVPVSADNHDQYVCLKTTDQYGNVSYQSSARLDTEISRVSLQISNNQVRMTAGEILTSVWAEATAGTACDYASLVDSGTTTAQGVTALSVSYDDTTHGIVCFSMTDRHSNSANYSYTLDTVAPTNPADNQTGLAINQSGRIVIATANDEDQRHDDHRGDNDYPKDWGIKSWNSYSIETANDGDLDSTLAAVCDADSYGKSGSADSANNVNSWTIYNRRTSGDRIAMSSSYNSREAICFRATDYSGLNSYGHKKLVEFESSDPIINSHRNNYGKEVTLSLSSANNKRATTWRSVAMEIDEVCDISLIPSITAPTSSNKIEITESDIGGLFCVEVLLNDNSRIYQIVKAGSSQIDTTGPVISSIWERNFLRAAATDDLSGVKSTTWQWQIITNRDHAESSCQDDDTADPKITSWRRGNNTGSLGTSRNGQFICFRVSDNVGNTTYANFEIEVVSTSTDTSRPTVNVRRNGNTVTATSTASDLPSVPDWRYIISNNSTCNDKVFEAVGSSLGYGSSVQLVDGDDVWVCFQVTDSSNNAGHGKLRVDLAGPTITVSQSGNQVTANANESASQWIYFRSDNRPDYCVDDSEWNFNQHQTFVGRTVSGLTSADVGRWLCFRAQDSNSNQGVTSYQISGPIGQPIQANPLTISFAQGPTQLVASGNRTVSSWRYLVYESAPSNCDGDNAYFDSDFAGNSNVVALDADDNGRYYCFEANASDGTQAYASHRVNIASSPSTTPQPVDALTVDIEQENNQLVASANRAVSSWRYLVYTAEPADCDNSNSYFAADNGRVGRSNTVDLVAEDSGRYYCFEATDTNDRKAYYLHQVETVVVNPKPETITPEPTTPEPVVATPEEVKISASRVGQHLVAKANQPITQWRYLIYATKPNCDNSNSYFDQTSRKVGKSNKAVLVTNDNDRYYCFRAKTADGRVAFALYLVPATTTATEPVSTETVVIEPPATTEPQTEAPEPEQGQEEQPTTQTPAGTEQPPVKVEVEVEVDKTPLPVDQTTPTKTTVKDADNIGRQLIENKLPWVWIAGGVAVAILIVLLVFRPRRNSFDDEADDDDDHDLNV